ncbi:MAG: 3-oxoadipate enol-lactonase [Hyphomicrobiales bacterium]|nr:3-oxoadipate enol-lactonase [Hyphomicrobiales bacterium]
MPYSTRNGLRIHYETHGAPDAPPMVLIHANPFDRRLWLYQVARFSPFYRVVAVDLRGYGHSDKPEGAPFTLRDMMQDVLGVCADEGISRAVFAGVSVGSGIAMLIALDHPDMVEACVLVGGSSNGPRDVETIVAPFGKRDLGGYLMELMRGYVAPGFADTRLGNWALRLFVEDAGRLSAACIANIFRARASLDMTERLPGLKPPTLVVNGAYDLSLEAGRLTASRIPGARHVVLPNTGHACCIEDPEGFDAAMIDFLRDCGKLPPTMA